MRPVQLCDDSYISIMRITYDDLKELGTSREYVRELISKNQNRLQLSGLPLGGAATAPAAMVDGAYCEGLRDRVHKDSSWKAKAVVPRKQSNRDVDETIAYYLGSDAARARRPL
jgi:hypothetical protein